MNDDEKMRVVLIILDAILATIREAGPMGAPAGHLYAALMSKGVNLDTFEKLMELLVKTGKVTKRGHCYFPVDK